MNVVLKDIQIKGVAGPDYFTNNVTGTGLDGAAPLAEREKRPPKAR